MALASRAPSRPALERWAGIGAGPLIGRPLEEYLRGGDGATALRRAHRPSDRSPMRPPAVGQGSPLPLNHRAGYRAAVRSPSLLSVRRFPAARSLPQCSTQISHKISKIDGTFCPVSASTTCHGQMRASAPRASAGKSPLPTAPADCRLPTADRAADCRLPTGDCRLPTALPTADRRLPTADCRLTCILDCGMPQQNTPCRT